jgi:hypothetical protein
MKVPHAYKFTVTYQVTKTVTVDPVDINLARILGTVEEEDDEPIQAARIASDDLMDELKDTEDLVDFEILNLVPVPEEEES